MLDRAGLEGEGRRAGGRESWTGEGWRVAGWEGGGWKKINAGDALERNTAGRLGLESGHERRGGRAAEWSLAGLARAGSEGQKE